MIRILSTFVLLLLLIPAGLTWAQEPAKGIKIYSGYLYRQGDDKAKKSFWHGLFGSKSPREEAILDRPCSVEFDSSVFFSHESVSVVPEQLAYFVRFQNEPPSFGKFVIKVYTSDDEEYTIDPDSEGRKVSVNGAHHIFDAYLIYMLLGEDIDHLEVISTSGSSQGRYILDKMEIRDN